MLQKIKSDRICATCGGGGDLSLRCVAATCCCKYSPDLYARSDLSPLLAAATCGLVCIDLKNGDFGAIFVTERS